ncbi:LAME_0H17414g1_1 [Lachancea meyersii CBS 8951]|uniref:LAME_0H17414g1_1 n=1 Tax=Lachancea meyersii CBS 8951 TaxID=1266667 RepID=A0A1G4KIC1_9SACH|nr:LAME_0H17414g1_1 [Lachancea meyersii CBS 8951]
MLGLFQLITPLIWYTILLVAGLITVGNISINGLIALKGSLGGLRKVVVGLPCLNRLYFSHFVYGNYQVSVGRLLVSFLQGYDIELKDVAINIGSINHQTVPSPRKWVSSDVLVNYKVLALLRFLGPRKFVLKNLTLHWPECGLSWRCAAIEIGVSWAPGNLAPAFEVEVTGVEDSRGTLSLATIQYNLNLCFEQAVQQKNSNPRLRLKCHDHSLILNGLSIQIDSTPSEANELTVVHNQMPSKKATAWVDNPLIISVLSSLTGLDLRLENVSIGVGASFAINSCAVFLSLNAIDAMHHGMLDSFANLDGALIHELVFTINSTTLLLSNEPLLRLPSVTLTSVSNIASTLISFKRTHPAFGCTLAAVDPSVTLTQKQLIELWELLTLRRSRSVSQHSSKDNGWLNLFGLTKSPDFVSKVLISNISFTLKVSSSKHFVFRTTNVHAFAQNQNRLKATAKGVEYSANDPKQTRDYMDNFLKIDKFSLTYFLFDESDFSKIYDLPVILFSKWEFFGENLYSEKTYITSTLRNLSFLLEDVEVIRTVIHYVNEWRARLQSQNSQVSKVSKKPKYSLQLRLKNTSASLRISHYLPHYLDKLGAPRNLSDYTRGLIFKLREAYLDFSSEGQKMHITNGSIQKSMEDDAEPAVTDELACMENIVFETRGEKYHSLVPACSVSFDVNTVWLFFYLRTIIQGLSQTKNTKSWRKTLSRASKINDFLQNIDVDVVSLLIKIKLPHSIKLFLAVNNGVFIGEYMTFRMGSFKAFTTSVYESDDIFVPVLALERTSVEVDKLASEQPLEIRTETIWVTFEYHLRLYKILDNICTMVKCIKTINLNFKDTSNMMAREPQMEEPRKVYPINVQANAFLIKVEEDPFEQEVGLIFKVGVTEQLERIEKLKLLEKELSLRMTSNGPTNSDSKYLKLFEQFSVSWINRIKKARLKFFGRPSMNMRSLSAGTSSFDILEGLNSTILKVEIEKVSLKLRQPSFPLDECHAFFYKYGKRMPENTRFTTLIPLGVELLGSRCEFTLRDYPLPIVFFPEIGIRGDLILAERMPSQKSKRYVHVPFVPGAIGEAYSATDSIYGSNIIRTLNPLKAYMNLKCQVKSDKPTTITWGKSLQPGFQAVMIWFDYLTKPPVDPSEKLGFWDKFRLLFHGCLILEWLEDSEFHLNLKGSHDPYLITDMGAGLSFCWRGAVRLSLHESSDPTEFLKITSRQFLLAIRDFTHPRRLDKVLMKLSGNVTWTMGISFESGNLKDPGSSERCSAFKPHYEINLCNPVFLDPNSNHDSYDGFRSDFIHLFFQVMNEGSKGSSNKVHLAPHSMTHFFSWWNLFSTYTSGPIRQGPLFPNLVQNPKKFSKALFTVKYALQLSPLMISHTYLHADSQLGNDPNNETAFTSLKGSFDSLTLDLHQKRVKMNHADEKLEHSRTVWKFKMNAGEIDCRKADIRLIYSRLISSKEDHGHLRDAQYLQGEDSGTFACPKNDDPGSSWFDMEDYNDVNQVIGKSFIPRVFDDLPLLYSPRISYLRELSEGEALTFPFGAENEHECNLGHNYPMVTQELLARARAHELEKQLALIEKLISELTFKSQTAVYRTELDKRLRTLHARLHDFRHRLHIIHVVLEDLMLSKLPSESLISDEIESSASSHLEASDANSQRELLKVNTLSSFRSMRKATSAFVKSSFDNRFILHNILLKVNNKTRDVLLDYIFNVLNRKKSSFFQTYKSVALLDELLKLRLWNIPSAQIRKGEDFLQEDTLSNAELARRCEDIIRQVAEDGLEASDTYQVKFVLPQIQVTSEEVSQKCILVTARDIETSIVEINQVQCSLSHNAPLDVNSLVETRYATKLNEAHFFILDRDDLSAENGLGFELNGYGMDSDSAFWPPWLPMEMCYNCESLKDSVFLQRNDMIMLFTQPNSLFFQNQMNKVGRREAKVRIGFPKLTLASNSDQYSSIYAIAAEMLHFASSFDKKADKLSKVMLAEEVRNNLDKLDVSIIVDLQNSIKNLDRTRAYLRMHDPKGYRDVAQSIATELDSAVLELNLLMSAIKKNHDKMRLSNEYSDHQELLYWQIGADEVTWRLLDDQENDFVLFELGSTSFVRSQALDGTNSNRLTIKSLACFNLQKNAIYRNLLGPYEEIIESAKPLIEISWLVGPSVGGISDLVRLVVLLEPFVFKMDHCTSDILLRFLFPDKGNGDLSVSSPAAPRDSISSSSRENSTIINLNWRLKGMSSNLPSMSVRNPGRYVSPTPSALFSRNTQELNEMVDRSSRYFNVGSVLIQKVTMSISYRGSRSVITNVDGLTVKVPTLRYTNRLWSREEFIATLKKDIIKIVLQHTGNIIGNKLTLHKRGKEVERLGTLSRISSSASGNSHSARFPESTVTPRRHTTPLQPHGQALIQHVNSDASSTSASVDGFFPVTLDGSTAR